MNLVLRICYRPTSSRSADETEIAEFGHLVLHDGRVIAEFATVVFIVAGSNGYDSAVRDFSKGHDPKGDGQ